ncbi:MAG: MmcQ/YjbR family DNA-binding protein [Siphonobacter sp.]
MNVEHFRMYCLAKKGVTEETPFGPDTLVYKVMGKMFALTSIDSEEFSCNLKCDPERAIELRERHDWISPGFHMNKKHWNTLTPEITSPDTLVYELIDHSYELVVTSLPKKLQSDLSGI